MHSLRLWWSHLNAPLAVFIVLATLFATTPLDVNIARTVFFDSAHSQWVGAESWAINDLLHTGGRWAIRVLVAIALATWIASYFHAGMRALRRPAAFLTIAAVLSVGVVGLLKTVTNVDCPWDLVPFGGRFPFVELFADRPDALRAGHCFPAAHASSGYALLALYFVFRERRPALARLGLALGLLAGLTFGIAQQARGAHFVSHDVWSAFIVWTITLSVYAFGFRARLWEAAPDDASPQESTWEEHESASAHSNLAAADVRLAGDPGLGAGAARAAHQRRAGRAALDGADLHLQHADRAGRAADRD
ncbi:MAG TPA: phosphatase PAP2 family protein [Steroidobacteraceae bacterium]|nr:phosphatase PAP2 family protein [Steroidobacteraceae bacterium]